MSVSKPISRSSTKRPLDDMEWTLESFDTGQPLVPVIDTGQSAQLEIMSHDIHRKDIVADNSTEMVMSTLRKFNLKVRLSFAGRAFVEEDGLKLSAVLVFENGNVVSDLSQSMEPPLLGGEAILDSNGEASFELRITVLSSLCRGNKFRVQVTAAERPEYRAALTSPMRTITKLYRTPVSKKQQKASDAEALPRMSTSATSELPLEWPVSIFDELTPADIESATNIVVADCETADSTERTKEELWAEVTANGNLILELQSKQAELFQQLKKAMALRDAGDMDDKPAASPLATDWPEPLAELGN